MHNPNVFQCAIQQQYSTLLHIYSILRNGLEAISRSLLDRLLHVILISIVNLLPPCLLCSFTQRSSQRFFQESEKIFTQLIRSIEKIRSEVTELIGAQEKATVNQAEGIMKKLEQEIAELRRRNAELKQLSETKDHIHFLQNFQSLCVPPEAAVFPSVTVNPDVSFEAVRKAVSQLQHHIEDFCKGELVKITTTGWCENEPIYCTS
ncbi:UNVERIFIED_CONTAM: hypothetical protein FKN15_009221 [Acipenser sinensis]